MKITLLSLLALGLTVAVTLVVAAARWRAGTRELRGRLEDARSPIAPATYDPRQLESLPAPVRRYFATVLRPGQRMIAAVRVAHRGTFKASEAAPRWAPFTSDQRVITRRPGFDWDARVTLAPGLTAWVHDAYAAGEGILHVTLLGLVPILTLRGTPEVAQGELMRFLAEAAWYPTALLPGQGVRWESVDERSARGTMTDGPVTVSMVFRFDDQGLLESALAESRGRAVGDRVVPTPWVVRVSAYQERDGMRIPTEGEVAWLLPAGPAPYWRGRITRIGYEFAR